MLACHNRKMTLCPMEAILACDIGNVGSAGGSTTSCGDRTDDATGGAVLTSTLRAISAGNTGSAFADFLVFVPNGNVAIPASDVGGSAQYYCCLPAPTF